MGRRVIVLENAIGPLMARALGTISRVDAEAAMAPHFYDEPEKKEPRGIGREELRRQKQAARRRARIEGER